MEKLLDIQSVARLTEFQLIIKGVKFLTVRKNRITQLEDLKVREVSFVKKGANGEKFEIIKSDDLSPSDILKSMMQDPDFQDETDVDIQKEMGDEYPQYCNEFVDNFVSNLQKQGEDADSFLNEVIQEKLEKANTGKTSKEEPDDDEPDGDPDDTGKKKMKKSDEGEEEVAKSFLGSFSEVVKSIFSKDGKVEKGYMQDYASTSSPTEAEKQAQYYENCCESVLRNVIYAIQTVTDYGANKKMKDIVSQLFDIAGTLNNECISVQKSDSGDEDVSKMDFDMSKIKKVFEDFSEITGVEKGEENVDIKKELAEAMKPITDSITSISERVAKMEGEEAKPVETGAESEVAKALKEALEPVTKSLGEITERIDKVEKSANPSGKIEGQDDINKSAGEPKLWGSFSVGK
jgi:hypothetical protein